MLRPAPQLSSNQRARVSTTTSCLYVSVCIFACLVAGLLLAKLDSLGGGVFSNVVADHYHLGSHLTDAQPPGFVEHKQGWNGSSESHDSESHVSTEPPSNNVIMPPVINDSKSKSSENSAKSLTTECSVLKEWFESKCDSDTSGLLFDDSLNQVIVDVKSGEWHSIDAMKKESGDETLHLDTFAYYSQQKWTGKLLRGNYVCANSSERAVAIAQNIWLPNGCKVPLSSDLFNSAELFPPNYKALVLGNSYMNQIFQTQALHSVLRDEIEHIVVVDASAVQLIDTRKNASLKEENSTYDLFEVKKSKTQREKILHVEDLVVDGKQTHSPGVVRYHWKNGAVLMGISNSVVQCLKADSLLDVALIFMDELKSVNEIDLILMDGGNSPQLVMKHSSTLWQTVCSEKMNLTMNHDHVLEDGLIQAALERRGFFKSKRSLRNGGVANGKRPGLFLDSPRKYSSKNDGHYNYTFNFPLMLSTNIVDGESVAVDSMFCHSDWPSKHESDWQTCEPHSGHQCTPGNPDSYTEAFRLDAYLHHCQAAEWLRSL